MNKISSGQPAIRINIFRKVYLYYILYFLMCFCLLFAFRNVEVFGDEYDNIVGGMTVAKGLDVYQGYYSQHTPLMYYLCAIFRLLGANGLLSFRLYFYIFLSICFTAIYIRYNKTFGKKMMILFPIILITSYSLTDMSFSHMILSDQVQAIALSVLFLEWFQYLKTKVFNISNAIMLSIGIFSSIGVAFISVYFVAIVCVAIVIMEINKIRQTDGGLFKTSKCFVHKHWTTLLIIALPFLLLLLYYFFTGNLYNFYYQAYEFNAKIYSRYTALGTNPIKTFCLTINAFFGGFTTYCNKLVTDFSNSSRILMNYFCDAVFFIWLYRKNKFASAVTAFLIFSTVIRGMVGFHSITFWAVSALIIAFELKLLLERIKEQKERHPGFNFKQAGIVVLLMSIICVPYLSQFSSILPLRSDLKKPIYAQNTREYYINKILKPNEGFYVSDLSEGLYVNTNRISSIKVSCLVPWFSDVWEQDIISDLGKSNTKLIICNPNMKLWGYDFTNYAKNLYAYIGHNYKLLMCDAPGIYIRNEYYDEVGKQLNLKPLVFAPIETKTIAIGPTRDKKPVSQVFTATKDSISEVDVQVGTYARANQSKMKMTIEKANSDNAIYTANIDVPNLTDNAFAKIKFPKISIQKGEQYKISFEASETTNNDFVTIYRTANNSDKNAGYAVIDGQSQDYNLNIKVFGE